MQSLSRLAMAGLVVVLAAACAGADPGESGQDPTEQSSPTPAATATATTSAESDPQAAQDVADAAAATAEAGTVRFEVTVETEGTGAGDGTQPITAEGEEDFAAEQRRITFQGPEGDLEAIVDGTDIYVEVPGTEDDTWARVELDALVAGDVGFGGPGGLPFRSSQDNLRVLEDSVTRAAESGSEDVRGESTTRYDLTVDLEAAAQNANEANDTMAAIAEQSGVTELDMQVWVGEDDLIRRLAYSIDLSQADVDAATEGAEVEADPQGSVTVNVEYFDFGAEVDIELPSDEQIVDLDEQQIRDSMTMPQATESATESTS